MSDASAQEAYLLGCLYGRGSISVSGGRNYRIIFRVPFRGYSPIGVWIVNTLMSKSRLTFDEVLDSPEAQVAHLSPRAVATAIRVIRDWHPPNIPPRGRILNRIDDNIRLRNRKIAQEYLDWQKILADRESRSIQFVLKRLQDTAKFLATKPIVRDELSAFNIVNHVVECEIPAISFNKMKSEYSLDVGDIHLHFRVAEKIFGFETESLQEFVRGLADTTADFDYHPHISPHWRVQFSILFQNRELVIDLCRILQVHLKIPVYYIDWAGGRRGTRDHLLKTWVDAFSPERFPDPLFYNSRKQLDFIDHLKSASKLPPHSSSLRFCPGALAIWSGSKPKYVVSCGMNGCTQGAPVNVPKLATFGKRKSRRTGT